MVGHLCTLTVWRKASVMHCESSCIARLCNPIEPSLLACQSLVEFLLRAVTILLVLSLCGVTIFL